jgi:hypothetical protein
VDRVVFHPWRVPRVSSPSPVVRTAIRPNVAVCAYALSLRLALAVMQGLRTKWGLRRSCCSPSIACAPGQFPVSRCAYGHLSDCSCVRFRPFHCAWRWLCCKGSERSGLCVLLVRGLALSRHPEQVAPHCRSRTRPVPVLSPPS